MKILVVGAAGKSGRLVVERALAAGHKVVALVHSEKPEEKHPLPDAVEVVQGDVQNPSRLEHAMEGCEAVIDTIGGKKPFLATDLETSAAKVIINVMRRVGARRLIAISVLGAGESKEEAGFFYRNLLAPVFLRGAIPDKEKMEEAVAGSGLEYVLVRPPVLSDGEPTGQVKVVPEGEHAHRITRADLAQFLVDQLTGNEYLGQAVVVANR